jgi:hypothetical protein
MGRFMNAQGQQQNHKLDDDEKDFGTHVAQ